MTDVPKLDAGDATFEWCEKMADAFTALEKLAVEGGAYRLASRAQVAAETLRVARTLKGGRKLADSFELP